MSRAAVRQVMQIGVESTPGTAVAANRVLPSLYITPGVKVQTSQYRPPGWKFPSIAVPVREWVEAKLEGVPSYTDIVYVLSSILDTATISTPGGTSPRLWTFVPDTAAQDSLKTFTVEVGQTGTGYANRFSYAFVKDLALTFSRTSDLKLSGTIIARRLETGVTLTASPTTIENKPIVPGHVSVFLDTTAAGIGTTKLAFPLEVTVNISDRGAATWPLDAENTSFASVVETPVTATVEMTIAADSNGLALLTPMRTGDSRFMRIACVSSETIESTYNYQMFIDLCLKVTDVSEFSDEDGLYALRYTFSVCHDAAWGRAMQVQVQNALTGL